MYREKLASRSVLGLQHEVSGVQSKTVTTCSRYVDCTKKKKIVKYSLHFFLFSLFLDRAGLSSPRRGTEAEVRPDPMSEVCESQLAPRLLALEASVEKLLKLLSDEISASEDGDARHLKRIQELSRLVKMLQVDTTSHGSQDAVPTLCQSCSRHLLPQGSGKSTKSKNQKNQKNSEKNASDAASGSQPNMMTPGGPPHGSGYQASGAQPTEVLWGAVDRRPKSLEIISIVMVYAFKYRIGNFVKLCTFVRGGGGG